MTPPDGWVVVPNWERFQHYKDRGPVWVKLYTELNSRDDWRQLTFAQRGLLVSIWTEYARSGGQLRSVDIGGRVGQRDRHGTLDALIRAGFVEIVDSAPLSLARSREESRGLANASPLRKRGGAPPAAPEGGGAPPAEEDRAELLRRATAVAADWNGGASEEFDGRMDELERELHARLSHSQRVRLWEEALRRDRRTSTL